jgi:hypothetical protein
VGLSPAEAATFFYFSPGPETPTPRTNCRWSVLETITNSLCGLPAVDCLVHDGVASIPRSNKSLSVKRIFTEMCASFHQKTAFRSTHPRRAVLIQKSTPPRANSLRLYPLEILETDQPKTPELASTPVSNRTPHLSLRRAVARWPSMPHHSLTEMFSSGSRR